MANRLTVKLNSSQPDFLQFNNLACETTGAKRGSPEFLPSAFTEFGKWMDGWETRRKRIPGHDWCIVQLGVPGVIHGFDVDTSFFTGNYAPAISIQAACLDGLSLPSLALEGDRTGMAASESQFDAVAKLHSENWKELVPVTELKPGYSDSCHNFFSITLPQRVTHIRLNVYPDGGIARLQVYGVGQRDWSNSASLSEVDLVALVNGGVCVGYSDAHFGHPRNMIGLGRADSMADGWETARRLDRPKVLKADEKGILQVPGFEWAIFRLGHPGVIRKIEIDTNHFKGNFPDWCRIEACSLTPEEEKIFSNHRWFSDKAPKWRMLLPPQKLKPHYRHLYAGDSVLQCGSVSHVRLIIAPDGGVSRLRLWGQPIANNSTEPNITSKL
ncbi:allantoicase isoform X2 [Trichomycterus rosablanca]|uniref:allantoicase isoform X2 n=1 Tax=Trichomycterus rosablanca TaxID=2290929 RepID=UPI002F351F02